MNRFDLVKAKVFFYVYKMRLLQRLKDQAEYIEELQGETYNLSERNRSLAEALYKTQGQLAGARKLLMENNLITMDRFSVKAS